MQFISPPTLAALSLTSGPAGARLQEFAQRDEVRSFLTLILLALALGQIATVIAYWLASKACVGGERASFGNAVKVWLIYLFVFAAIIVGMFFAAGAVAEEPGSIVANVTPASGSVWMNFRMAAVIGGGALLMLAVTFLVPMKVYALNALRAFGFLLVSLLIAGAVQFGINKALNADARSEAVKKLFGDTEVERQAFGRRLIGQDAPDEIDRLLDEAERPIGKPLEFKDRSAAVGVIYQKLELKHRSIPPGNSKEAAAYQQQVERYKRVIEKLKADNAAQQAPAR